jgi:hypothetical protein
MKTVTDNQMTGERGETLIKAEFLKMGLVYHSFGRLESGTDGMVELRNPETGTTSSRFVAVQAKTRMRGRYTAESETTFHYRLDDKDLRGWTQSNLPVIIVLFRIEDGSIYWKSIAQNAPDDPRLLIFDKTLDVLNRAAVDSIANLMIDRATPGIWVPPLNSGEDAILNMLKVVLPKEIFVAVPAYSSGRQAAAVMVEANDARFDWSMRGDRVIFLHDPRGQSTEAIVEPDTVEAIEIDLIAESNDDDDYNDMAHLLRKCLERQFSEELMFGEHKRENLLAFRPSSICQPLDYAYRSAANSTKARVVAVKMRTDDPTRVSYVRHHAFHPKFDRIGRDWYLIIEPTYFFTYDGFRWHQRPEALLTGKKKLETNAAIWGQVLMWQHLLCQADELPRPDLFSDAPLIERGPLIFEKAPVVRVPVATPEQAWKRTDPNAALFDDPEQGGLF